MLFLILCFYLYEIIAMLSLDCCGFCMNGTWLDSLDLCINDCKVNDLIFWVSETWFMLNIEFNLLMEILILM